MDARPSPVQAFSGSLVSPLRCEVSLPGRRQDSLRSLRMTMDKGLQMQRVRPSNIHTNPSLSMGQRLVRNEKDVGN